MATILTPADLAEALGTDARTARKFLRSITPRDEQPGKGSRWAIEKKHLRSLRTKFAAFEKAQAEAKAQREAKHEQDAPSQGVSLEKAPMTDDAPVDEFDALEGPTDEDLAEIES